MKKLPFRAVLVLVILCLLTQNVLAEQLLIPGGQVIGLELQDNTVTVAAFDEENGAAAQQAGLQVGDRITGINGTVIHTAEDVRQALNQIDGMAEVSILRNGKAKKLRLMSQITENGPRLGVYLKQGVSGIGTVTWYDPEDRTFGALGHGVSSQEGTLLPMIRGRIYRANVVSVRMGKVGEPGQLMGAVQSNVPIGTLTKNTAQGVFGVADLGITGEKLPVAEPQEVKTGPAYIRSTVNGEPVQEYSVEILKVYSGSKHAGRNLLLKVTDPALLAATGGIVQGMSGSPIIQDGKLVGAVTHVLVNDPTTGYGIFIENMLDAAA